MSVGQFVRAQIEKQFKDFLLSVFLTPSCFMHPVVGYIKLPQSNSCSGFQTSVLVPGI